MVDYLPHDSEQVVDGGKLSRFFAFLEGDESVKVLFKDRLCQVFLLLGHLDVDYDFFTHRQVF